MKTKRMQHTIRIYNNQHLENHSIGNTCYLNNLTVITAMQLL